MRLPSHPSPCPALILIFLLGLNLVSPQPTEAQRQGYRIVGNHIIVNSPAHWERWSMPGHAVDILPSGGVHPHFSRSRFNVLDDLETYTRRLLDFRRKKNQTAVLNIDSTETLDVFGNIIRDRKKNPLYTYLSRIGISRVGSNPRAAANILDGDPSTFWEPDFNDPIEDWWVEVDLGRSLPVDELVLNFVDESLGDPFRQFRILSAPFQKVINQEVRRNPLSPRRWDQRLQSGPAGVLFPARPIQGRSQLDWGNRPDNPHCSNRFQVRPGQIDFRGGMVWSELGGPGRCCLFYQKPAGIRRTG